MRYRTRLPSICGLCLLAAGPPQHAYAQESAGAIALSDESVELRYSQSLATAGTELGFGLFWNERRDLVISGDLYVEVEALRFERLGIKVGPVGYAAMLNEEDVDVFSMAIGTEARYELLRRHGIDLVAEAAYAPDILTFGSADGLWDVTVRLELPLTDRITGFAGYRRFEIDLLEGETELEDALHLGIRYRFRR